MQLSQYRTLELEAAKAPTRSVLNVIQRPSEGKDAFNHRVGQTRVVEARNKNRRTIRVWYTEDLPKAPTKPGRIHQPGGGSAPRVTPIGARRQRNLSAAQDSSG